MIVSPLLLAAALSAAGPDVVARVDGTPITRAEIEARGDELQRRGMPSGTADAVDSAVLDVLLSGEAHRTGLDQVPAVRDQVQREIGRAAAAVLIEQAVAAAPVPTEEALRASYHQTADSVRLDGLVYPSEDAARVGLSFARRSGKLDDGALAPVRGFPFPGAERPKIRAQLPRSLADAAFAAPLGEIIGPVELPEGWAVLRVLERTVGDEDGFQARREAILQFSREQNASAIRKHLADGLRGKAKVTVDRAFLASLGKRLQTTAAELDHVVATVDGKPIRYREIEPSVSPLLKGAGHGAGPALREQVLETEIGDRLLATAALDRGLAKERQVAERIPSIERRALATALVERVGASIPPPTEKEIAEFHRKNVASSGASLAQTRDAIAAHLVEERRTEALLAKGRELRARADISVDRVALGLRER
jgi:hypothetical protein